MSFCLRALLIGILLSAGEGVPPLNAAEAAPDHFRFMELQRQLQESPEDPKARPGLFGVGEYFYQIGQPSAAEPYFQRMDPRPEKGPMDLLGEVYLLLCALAAGDDEKAADREESLQRALAERHFVGLFQNARRQSWRSPMGNRYELHEEVDRLEIRVNDKEFHTIRLS